MAIFDNTNATLYVSYFSGQPYQNENGRWVKDTNTQSYRVRVFNSQNVNFQQFRGTNSEILNFSLYVPINLDLLEYTRLELQVDGQFTKSQIEILPNNNDTLGVSDYLGTRLMARIVFDKLRN